MNEVTIAPELVQSLDDYRRAFIWWAVAAYAYEINQGVGDLQRRTRMGNTLEAAAIQRDDAHIQFVADMFAYGNPTSTYTLPDEPGQENTTD